MVDAKRSSRVGAGSGAAKSALLAACGLCIGWVAPVYAQANAPSPERPGDAAVAASEGGLEDIVVTAQKRSENVQRVPIAITAVSSESLRAGGIIDTAALSAVVPGLSSGVSSGYFQPRIRSIGTTSIGPGIENPVALYVDGVYYSSQVMGLTDLTDVANVAVLKGPQGTLFGRNATGGVIQMTTREPTAETELDLRTSIDTYGTSRSNVYVSGGSDILKGNVSITYATQGRGWGRNVFNNDEIHKIDDEVSARGKVTFTPSAATTIKLAADYRYGENTMGFNARPFPGTNPGFPNRATRPYDTDMYRTDTGMVRNSGFSGTVEQDLGFARLVSISAYRDYRYKIAVVPYSTFVPSIDLDVDQRGRQISQEVQLVSNRGAPVTWVVGLFYFDSNEDLPAFDTNIRFGGPGPTRVATYSRTITKSYAAFGQATVEVLPKTNLTLGGRYTVEKRKFFAQQNGFINTIPIGQLGPDINDSFTVKKPTWRIAIDHQFSARILGYASYNRGFKSGGFNPFVPTEPSYEPEQLDAFEIGLKSDLLDRTIRLNLAGFYYDYKNIQVSRFTTTTVVFNGAAATVYGAEADLTARLARGLTFASGFSFNHAKFDEFPSAPFYNFLPAGGADIFYASAAGNKIPFAAKYTLSSSLDYENDFDFGKVQLNLTNFWSSKFYAEPNNQLAQGAYDLLNASVTWTASNGRLSVGLFGRNLFDKKVFGYAQISPGEGAQVDYTNPPRTFGVNLRYHIGG